MTDRQPEAPTATPPRQEQEEASEEVTEVAPGVLRMQLPIWMPGLGHVNMYGLVDDRGLAVVDPGLPGPQSWKALKARLKTAGYRVKDIHTVLVTHSHPDHFGGAGRIAREAGAELVTHHAFSTWTVKGPSPQRALIGGRSAPRRESKRPRSRRRSTSNPTSSRRSTMTPTSCTTTPRRREADVEPVGRDHAVGHDATRVRR